MMTATMNGHHQHQDGRKKPAPGFFSFHRVFFFTNYPQSTSMQDYVYDNDDTLAPHHHPSMTRHRVIRDILVSSFYYFLF
jgi:hypothetical protein